MSVEWSEAIISCNGSVSQYVLSVTPPTSDCQSNCASEFMTDQTQYNMTLAANVTYNITLRADACDSTGNYSDTSIELYINGMKHSFL